MAPKSRYYGPATVAVEATVAVAVEAAVEAAVDSPSLSLLTRCRCRCPPPHACIICRELAAVMYFNWPIRWCYGWWGYHHSPICSNFAAQTTAAEALCFKRPSPRYGLLQRQEFPPQTTTSSRQLEKLPAAEKMSKSVSESSEDFEFIETPAAPTPVPPAENYGVRTTSVRLPPRRPQLP
jgi:hypothetical protein